MLIIKEDGLVCGWGCGVRLDFWTLDGKAEDGQANC